SQITLHPSATQTPHIAGQHLIVPVVQIHGPTGVTPGGISMGPARKRQAQVDESTLCSRWKLVGNYRCGATQTEHKRGSPINALGRSGAGESGSVVEL